MEQQFDGRRLVRLGQQGKDGGRDGEREEKREGWPAALLFISNYR